MLQKIINLLKHPKLIKTLLSHAHSGYLYEKGWVKSYLNKMPVDKYENPIPWVTYPFIRFIELKLNKDMNLFEFGCGNSTLFYSNKVNHVDCVEHDKKWYETIKLSMPNNVDLMLRSLDSEADYVCSANEKKMLYDIIIVDGRQRVACILNAYNSLSESGCLVLDDSERAKYQEGISFMVSKGFKRLDFWGIAPGLFYEKSTSIFYRELNTLGL